VTAAHYGEQARRALEAGREAGVLPERAALCWRTHDHGLLTFQGERLEEAQAAELRRLLGHGRQAAPEEAAFPVRLLYSMTRHGMGEAALPGKGRLVESRSGTICLSADPLSCVQALAAAEQRGREAVLSRLLSDGATPPEAAQTRLPEEEGSCGQCGGLLGCSACAGSACVRHGR